MNPHLDQGGIRGSLARYGKITACLLFTVVFSSVSAKTTSAEDGISSAPEVVINEVLANEPGTNTRLEWVELHNADSVEHNLEGWAFISKDDTTRFPTGSTIPASGFLILARRLL
ncbi:MAG: lamin tail domain-containing protein, partial [Proteobacteria bacterium]|nr:lamin tail domain-containing protein [Pseudomonadota bacterium]